MTFDVPRLSDTDKASLTNKVRRDMARYTMTEGLSVDAGVNLGVAQRVRRPKSDKAKKKATKK